jgi:K+/H+ antiporter YhaU regulatory subunit KhtT
MATPCTKEQVIETLIKGQTETARQLGELADKQSDQISRLIKIETLLDSLIKYQLDEAGKKLSNHESRISDLENIKWKIVAFASVGSIIGGFVFQVIVKAISVKW